MRNESGELRGLMVNLVFVKLLVPLYRSWNPQAAVGLSNRSINFRNMEVIVLTTEIITLATGILTNDKRLKALTHEGLSVWLFDTLKLP